MREPVTRASGVSRQQVRRLRHEYRRNGLTALSWGLLEQGQAGRERPEQCAQPAGRAGSGAGRFTENDTVNIVLSAKAREIGEAGLEADIRVFLPEKLPVADPDPRAVWQRAGQRGRGGEGRGGQAHHRARPREKGLLMLRVVNAYAGKREEKPDGLFGTTKADQRAHGFGLRGVAGEIAARYGGTLEAAARDGKFELVACLPLAEVGPNSWQRGIEHRMIFHPMLLCFLPSGLRLFFRRSICAGSRGPRVGRGSTR